MKIPYVVDNQNHKLADIFGGLLVEHVGRSLDVATAYFTVGGFELIRAGLHGLGNFRLLLGAEPASGQQGGLRPESNEVQGLLRRDLEDLPFDETSLRLVEDLIGFCARTRFAYACTTGDSCTPSAGCFTPTGLASRCCLTASGRFWQSLALQTLRLPGWLRIAN